ncbi:MAG: glycolate oxidase subunit GlcE [Rhodoferax sp.]
MIDRLNALIERVRDAATHSTPLRLQGHASKDFYGEAAPGTPLSLRDYQGIVSYEPTELVVTARCGTPLIELESTLAERGQCLAFEPPRFGGAGTVGGMVASGLAGPARASVGGVRDFVLGVELINGRAQVLRFGGQVMKNVAGYDVARLMVGALGTLGIVTEVSLKVLPIAPAQTTLCFALTQAEALGHLHTWLGQPLPINASLWAPLSDGTEGPRRAPGQLWLRLRGAHAAVEAACAQLLAQAPGQRLESAQAQTLWDAERDQRASFFNPPDTDACLWRLSLPPTAAALDLPYAQRVDWHGGQRWLWAPASAAQSLRTLAAQAGGSATLYRAGAAAAPHDVPRFDALTPALLQIHQRLKAEFDPVGIFNPGRLYHGL